LLEGRHYVGTISDVIKTLTTENVGKGYEELTAIKKEKNIFVQKCKKYLVNSTYLK
jgi:hypothetical protein